MKIEEVVNCGGIAEKNPLVMQIYADVCNRPMKVSRSAQTCAVGAAIFGAVAGGAHANVAAAQEKMTGTKSHGLSTAQGGGQRFTPSCIASTAACTTPSGARLKEAALRRHERPDRDSQPSPPGGRSDARHLKNEVCEANRDLARFRTGRPDVGQRQRRGPGAGADGHQAQRRALRRSWNRRRWWSWILTARSSKGI